MLTVTVPADGLHLLTAEELRLAAGLDPSDGSQDTELAMQGLQAAAALAAACGVANGAAIVRSRRLGATWTSR